LRLFNVHLLLERFLLFLQLQLLHLKVLIFSPHILTLDSASSLFEGLDLSFEEVGVVLEHEVHFLLAAGEVPFRLQVLQPEHISRVQIQLSLHQMIKVVEDACSDLGGFIAAVEL